MSQIGRLRASYSGMSGPAPPATFVVKLPTIRPANREMAEHYGLFERETRFYNELAPIVGVRTPRAFVSRHDPATGDAVLLLEELTVRGGDTVTVLCDDEVRTIVRSMASFHGRWCGGLRPRSTIVDPAARRPDVVVAPGDVRCGMARVRVQRRCS